MRDWGKYTKQQILKGSENGQRLVLEFSRDYKELTGGEFCMGCHRKFDFQLNKFLNYFGMKVNNTGYKLHTKYNGLTLPGYRNDVLSNYKMTEAKAIYFILFHQKGQSAFQTVPKDLPEKLKAIKESIDLEAASVEERKKVIADFLSPKEESFNVHTAKKDDLIAFAQENGIDLGDLTKVNDIRPVVKEWIDNNS